MSRCDTCNKGCDSTCHQPELWEQGEMTPIEAFYAYHHCREPKPASDKPNMFGGIRCETCSFEIMVVSWLGGMKGSDDNQG